MSGSFHRSGRGTGGRIVGTLFFAVFTAIAGTVGVLVSLSMFRSLQTRSWMATPCTIVQSQVRERDANNAGSSPYEWSVKYEYEFSGRQYSSTQVERGSAPRYSDYGEAMRKARAAAPGSTAECYVNPADPGQAVLEQANPWVLLFLLIPLTLCAVGVGGLYFTWRSKKPAGMTAMSRAAAPSRRIGRIVFGAFLAAGLLFSLFFIGPIWRAVASQKWIRTPCTVVSSHVRSHDSGEDTTYSADIVYEYAVGGQTYRSNRYSVMGGSSSGMAGKQAIVQAHRKGTKAVCWVDPSDPWRAVLHRGFEWPMLFVLIPLAFVAFGGIGLLVSLRGASRAGKPAAGALGRLLQSAGSHRFVPGQAAVLTSTGSRIGKLVALLAFTAIWNGIVSVFVVHVLSEWMAHRPRTLGGLVSFESIFMLPFIAVGTGCFVGVLYQVLALFNPRTELSVGSRAVSPGDTLGIGWRIIGRSRVVQRLRIYLEARESATYNRGTTTTTDTRPFARIMVVDLLQEQGALGDGQTELQIPADAMPTFIAAHNTIKWYLCVRGEIPRWPDIRDDFAIEVLAPEVGEEVRQ